MAPMSRGKQDRTFKVAKAGSKNNQTQTLQKHRFVPFAQRISGIKIKPVRPNAQAKVHYGLSDGDSHFRSAFELWKDRNMSEAFTSFAQQADPLCQSLAQLLYHQTQLVDMLLESLAKADVHALEPLLDLATQMAYDLGPQFEPLFDRTIHAISTIAAQRPEIQAIEWGFSAMAAIFRHLQRVLTADLTRVFSLMAPLMGKLRQKAFVCRFAAEALSFLVRKISGRPEDLSAFVAFVASELVATEGEQQLHFRRSIMFMFSEAMRGVSSDVRSDAPAILKALLHAAHNGDAEQIQSSTALMDMTEGVIISIIHNTNAQGFFPLLDSILSEVSVEIAGCDPRQLVFSSRLLLLVVGVRKASRISALSNSSDIWARILVLLESFIQAVNNLEQASTEVVATVLDALAVFIQYCPLSDANKTQRLMKLLETPHWTTEYLRFCAFVDKLDPERFDLALRPHLEDFVIKQWQLQEEQILELLPHLSGSGLVWASIMRNPGSRKDVLTIIESFVDELEQKPFVSSRSVLLAHCILKLEHRPEAKARGQDLMSGMLLRAVRAALASVKRNNTDEATDLALSAGLKYVAATSNASDELDLASEDLLGASDEYSRSIGYLEAILELFDHGALGSECETSLTRLVTNLIDNLQSPLHDIRCLSLRLLIVIASKGGMTAPQSLGLALEIEETPVTLQNQRNISMNVRRLGQSHCAHQGLPWIASALSAFCMGLLHVKLTRVHEDVCEALESLCASTAVQDETMSRAVAFLQTGNVPNSLDKAVTNEDSGLASRETDFECSNLSYLRATSDSTRSLLDNSKDYIRQDFINSTRRQDRSSPADRTLALKALTKLCSLAEKKSRSVVPIFMEWFRDAENKSVVEATIDSDDDTVPSLPSPPPDKTALASRDEKKAMLNLFSHFVNPRVLFKSEEVYSVLLELLCVGDVDYQRSALKALLAWKQPSITPYETHLLNILDDDRLREELAVFLNVGEDISTIRTEHTRELMPILLRLLYGRIISRAGIKNRGGQDARRKAILLSLSRFGHGALDEFINIAIEPLQSLHLLLLTAPPQIDEDKLKAFSLPLRKQLGMCRMVHEILDSLGNFAEPFGPKLMEAVLFSAIQSSRKLSLLQDSDHSPDQDLSLLKSVRQEALRCVNLLFTQCEDRDWTGHIHVVRQELIQPRLPKFPTETAQGISHILRLFSTWASSAQAITVVLDISITTTLTDCLVEPSARDEVKTFIMRDILQKAIGFLDNLNTSAQAPPSIVQAKERVSDSLAQLCLTRVSEVLSTGSSKDVLEASVSLVISLAPYLQEPTSLERLFEVCLQLLDPNSKNTSPRTKSQILSLLQEYIPKSKSHENETLYRRMAETLSVLFGYFLDGNSRDTLARLFDSLAQVLPELQQPSALCKRLNAFSGSRLDQPDFDTRMDAFDSMSRDGMKLTAFQWRPIVYNLMYLLKDEGEFSAMRLNAGHGLRRFVTEVYAKSSEDAQFTGILKDELLPALIKGVREPSELVRQEHLAVLEQVIKHDANDLNDLKCLTSLDGESFFVNVLHIQHHQRLQAMRKLVKLSSNLSSASASRVIVPLLETMLTQTEEGSQSIADEIIKTLEVVLRCLNWSRYRFLVHRMINERSRFESKKGIRVLAATVSALSRADQERNTNDLTKSALSSTLPASEDIFQAFSKNALGKLLEYVHYKDESTVDLRVIVAHVAVKMIMTFPEERINEKLPPVLMDVSSVLRSKAQEARDAARKTVADISTEIGPIFFTFVIKQLRASLQRGTQLHVLSYTVHSLLLAVSTKFRPGEINTSVPEVMGIVLDDVLGQVAQDKEAEGIRSKMKEVKKKALGYDSVELLAAMITPEVVVELIRPLRAELGKPRPKLDKLDELFRRLREGFRRNTEFADHRTLILCYELLQESMQTDTGRSFATDPSSYKVASFAMELLRRILDKHEGLKTADRLQAFIPIVSRALKEGEEDTQVAAMKLLNAVVKIPLSVLDEQAGEYLKTAKAILEAEVSTDSSLAQAALRLSAAVLRERPNAVMKRANFTEHLAYMLSRVKPDLYEPAHSHERGRQTGAFNLLKAALGRGVLINEVYDVMETVREVMITSPESEIRSSARAVYSRFVLDYFPHGGKAFEQQMNFMRKNLQYEMPEGRRSVMEVIDFVLNKTKAQAEVAQPLVMKLWNSLLDLLTTDTNITSRETAGILLQKLFRAADVENERHIKKQMLQFLDDDMPDVVQRAGYKGWVVWFDKGHAQDQDVANVFGHVDALVRNIEPKLKRSRSLVVEDALQCLKKLCAYAPKHALAPEASPMWRTILTTALESSQTGLRTTSGQLVNVLLVDIVKTSGQTTEDGSLECSGGLKISTAEISQITDSAADAFRAVYDEAPISQAAQSLRLVARVAAEGQQATPRILERLSSVIRHEDSELRCKLAALKLLSAISKESDTNASRKALESIALSMSNLIDSNFAVPLGEEEIRDQLVDSARELLAGLRERMDNNEYVGVMQNVQKKIKERREERKAKRRIEAVSRPEEAGRKKAKKAAAKKVKRKEQNEMHAGRRRGY